VCNPAGFTQRVVDRVRSRRVVADQYDVLQFKRVEHGAERALIGQ
jgi:hypothetical protein